MQTITLEVRDDYVEKIIAFLKLLPEKLTLKNSSKSYCPTFSEARFQPRPTSGEDKSSLPNPLPSETRFQPRLATGEVKTSLPNPLPSETRFQPRLATGEDKSSLPHIMIARTPYFHKSTKNIVQFPNDL
ncbi:MAG: hypothetical protein Q8N78_09220 [Sulfurimonas sp.]|nr:hypothetical protein [Sulfurimonas sp.]